MSAVYLIIIIVGVAGQNIIKKSYTRKTGTSGAYLFSALTAFFSMAFFIVTARNISWNSGIIPYSIAFALSFAASAFFGLLAVANGPLSLSSLMISYSLMIPTFYGIIFLKEPISICFVTGLVLLVISLFLVNKKNDKCPITPKWLLFVFLSFVGNGLCSTFQKMQQVAFNGAYKNEFMILALAMVVLILSVFVITKERKDIKTVAAAGWHLALACGIANGMVNLFVMILSNIMPVSLMFPMISAGGIVITYIVSRFFYKERLTKMQLVGFVIGTVSVVFLNI